MARASREWSREEPGPELAAALVATSPMELADDGGYDAAERLAAWDRLASWVAGRGMREIAEYARDREAIARGVGERGLELDAVAMEIATLTRMAPRTGGIRMHEALTLHERLPQTLAVLEAGLIGLAHARVIIDQTEECSPEIAKAVDTELWNRPARDRTPAQLREVVRRIVIRLDPDSVRRRPEQARRDRDVRYWSERDGATGVVQIRLPADEARGVFAVIDHLARRAGDAADAEPRTAAQKRADTARDLILDGAARAHPSDADDGGARDGSDLGTPSPTGSPGSDSDQTGSDQTGSDQNSTEQDGRDQDGRDQDSNEGTDTGQTGTDQGGTEQAGSDQASSGQTDTECVSTGQFAGRGTDGPAGVVERRDVGRGVRVGERSPVRAEVRLTISWETLAGLSERPGELEGHGPIPAELARRLAADPESVWRRLLTDPVTGTAAHLDARRYRPPTSLTEFVRTRDLTCAAPGCRMPAARCDLDHVLPYDHCSEDRGGPPGGVGATVAQNLRPCCRRHHNLKTHTGWATYTAPDPAGGAAPVVVWVSPSGHKYRVRSPQLEPAPWEEAGGPAPQQAA